MQTWPLGIGIPNNCLPMGIHHHLWPECLFGWLEVVDADPMITPPDEGLGKLTNITPGTSLTLSSGSYNVAIILDMSASMFTVVHVAVAHLYIIYII